MTTIIYDLGLALAFFIGLVCGIWYIVRWHERGK